MTSIKTLYYSKFHFQNTISEPCKIPFRRLSVVSLKTYSCSIIVKAWFFLKIIFLADISNLVHNWNVLEINKLSTNISSILAQGRILRLSVFYDDNRWSRIIISIMTCGWFLKNLLRFVTICFFLNMYVDHMPRHSLIAFSAYCLSWIGFHYGCWASRSVAFLYTSNELDSG